MLPADYLRDGATGVWCRPDGDSIAYSDGQQVEEQLLQAVQRCTDLRVLSDELPRQFADWPTEYHLSRARANLLRPIPLAPAETVLELGCGCGAITRALGERGARVVALDGSVRRATITASRCRDLPNVTVVHDTIAAFRPAKAFDVVTLIGVLEYAPRFFKDGNPVERCLATAASHLRPGGRLVLAIENQLGLKYFAGCAEDHLGRRYFGIHDLYSRESPVTFGRAELARLLHAAGLEVEETIYPFPDYKVPTVLIHERGLQRPDLNAADLLVRLHSREYGGHRLRAFDESLAWQVLGRNGLIGELANSFLIVARRLPRNERTGAELWLAKTYAAERRRTYATATTIETGASGMVVEKVCLEAEGAITRSRLTQALGRTAYRQGELLQTGLNRILSDGADLDRIARWAAPWVGFLRAHAGLGDALSASVPADFLDCVPFNLVDVEGQLHYIDAEWDWGAPLPLYWPLIRGLAYSAQRWWLTGFRPAMTSRRFATEVAARLGFELTERHFAAANDLENEMQREVYGWASGLHLDAPMPGYDAAFDNAERALHAARDLALAQAELRRVKATLSWRMTKPLRLATNLLNGRLFREWREARR